MIEETRREKKYRLKLCPICRQPQSVPNGLGFFACANGECGHECHTDDLLSPPETFESYRVLAHYADLSNVKFEVSGQPMSARAVFMPELFLPVIVAHGYRIWQRMSFSPMSPTDVTSFGATVYDCSDALFGVSVACAPIRNGEISSTMRLMALTKAAEEVLLIEKDKEIELDRFIDQYSKLDWSSGLPPVFLPADMFHGSFRGRQWNLQSSLQRERGPAERGANDEAPDERGRQREVTQ